MAFGRIMKVFETLSEEDQWLVKEMSDSARSAMRADGVSPANDDRCAVFDEACAIYLVESRKGYPK